MCRGTVAIAASTVSSLTPSSRTRSIMRARVRVEVMPMPLNLSPVELIGSAQLSRREPLRHARQLAMMREVDLKRRYRNVALIDGVKVGAIAGIRGRPRGADPVAGLPARRDGLDHRLRLVPAPEAGHAETLDIRERHVGNVDVEKPPAEGLLAMPLQQLHDHGCRGVEVPADLARQ